MPCQLTLTQLAEIVHPIAFNLPLATCTKTATGIETDTRTLEPQEVFVALRGSTWDGHQFVDQAIEKGAIAVIAQQGTSLLLPKEIPQFYVKDTLSAYQQIARWWREQLTLPVIGVTGSVGKTTTKELIAAVLSTAGKVLKTQANYNNEIGVPKTLLRLGPDDDYAVIEMAMRARGEIAQLTQIARPNIGVITNVGTAHIGRLGSESAIAQAKCELLAEMSADGVAVLNYDDARLLSTAASVWQKQTVTYGLSGGDVQGKLINSQALSVDGVEFPLPIPGQHNARNYLAAIAVAKVLNLDLTPLTAGISVTLPQGRSRRYALANDILVLDETYNAGLESMLAALHLLKETPGKRHLAVLGTMKELGAHSARLHRQVGATARELGLDALAILVDEPETAEIAAGAAEIPSECFATRTEILERLASIVQPGDRILFKASNSVGLTQVVEQFCAQFSPPASESTGVGG